MTIARKLSPTATLLDRFCVFLSTGLYISILPAALIYATGNQKLREKKWTGAGLFGSFEGALTYLFLPSLIAFSWWAPLVGIALSVVISTRAEKALESHDDSRIVIDEWIGAWIAVWGLPQHIGPVFVAAFLLFRLFDVLKGPIGNALQRFPGGWGVTFDDVYAGLFANVLWRISVGVFHIPH